MMRKLVVTFLLSVFCFLPGIAWSDANAPSFMLWPSHSDTASANSPESVGNFQNCYLVVKITALGVGQTLRLRVQAPDGAGSGYFTIEPTTVALAATGTTVYAMGPVGFAGSGVTEVIGVPLPRRWRLSTILANGENITFSVAIVPIGGF